MPIKKYFFSFIAITFFFFALFTPSITEAADFPWTNPVGCVTGPDYLPHDTNAFSVIPIQGQSELQSAINQAQGQCGSGCVKQIVKNPISATRKTVTYTATCLPQTVVHYTCDNVAGSSESAIGADGNQEDQVKTALDQQCQQLGSSSKVAPNCVATMNPILDHFTQDGVDFYANKGFAADCLVRPGSGGGGGSPAQCGQKVANQNDCPLNCPAQFDSSVNSLVCKLPEGYTPSCDVTHTPSNTAFCSDVITNGLISYDQVVTCTSQDGKQSGYSCPTGDTLCVKSDTKSASDKTAANMTCAKNRPANALKMKVTNDPRPFGSTYEIDFHIDNAAQGYYYYFFPEDSTAVCNIVSNLTGNGLCSAIASGIAGASSFDGYWSFNTAQVPTWGDPTISKHNVCAQQGDLATSASTSVPTLGTPATVGLHILLPPIAAAVDLINLLSSFIQSTRLACLDDSTHATATVDIALPAGPSCIKVKSEDQLITLGGSGHYTVPLCPSLTSPSNGQQPSTITPDLPAACGSPQDGTAGYTCPKPYEVMCLNVTSDQQRTGTYNNGAQATTTDLRCASGPVTSGPITCGVNGIMTAIGCVPTDPQSLIQGSLRVLTLASGGIALLLMAFGAIGMMTSLGNPENLKKAQGQFVAAIAGLLFIIFAVLLMKIIGFDILNLPGFGA